MLKTNYKFHSYSHKAKQNALGNLQQKEQVIVQIEKQKQVALVRTIDNNSVVNSVLCLLLLIFSFFLFIYFTK